MASKQPVPTPSGREIPVREQPTAQQAAEAAVERAELYLAMANQEFTDLSAGERADARRKAAESYRVADEYLAGDREPCNAMWSGDEVGLVPCDGDHDCEAGFWWAG